MVSSVYRRGQEVELTRVPLGESCFWWQNHSRLWSHHLKMHVVSSVRIPSGCNLFTSREIGCCISPTHTPLYEIPHLVLLKIYNLKTGTRSPYFPHFLLTRHKIPLDVLHHSLSKQFSELNLSASVSQSKHGIQVFSRFFLLSSMLL